MAFLSPLLLSGQDVLPLIEGGKGISISTGVTAGAWAATGGVGTFSGVNADYINENGTLIPILYTERTRTKRHQELIDHAIQGGISQAKIAHEMAGGKGRIHINVLWEMGAVETILEGILKEVHPLIHGITCGAGMPYRLAQIASQFKIFYLPIVSSARAFSALWKRAYHKCSEWLGAVVYEDPWRAGGHNGLSNAENPLHPQDPYPRVLALRETMREFGLYRTPIVMAGGVWCLREWTRWINNEELGPIAFQFGTRPLLTQESPISPAWKQKLLTLKEGDISLNRFSPTGFYSSAIRNDFLENLEARSARQIPYTTISEGDSSTSLSLGERGRSVYVTGSDAQRATLWMNQGFGYGMKTPGNTLIFVTLQEAEQIRHDQIDCMGCLSACAFSNWSQSHGTTGQKPDPRSFCIQKTLQAVSHGDSIDHNLLFAGHNAYRFGQDPFYANGFIPTVAQLVEKIQTGG
jgi:NAD(P)H-dependent flavin oxidoreductase YrpB (nitropropane dioxygenase family)